MDNKDIKGKAHFRDNASDGREKVPQELLTMMYGQMRTLVDLLKEINKRQPVINSIDAVHKVEDVLKHNVRYGDGVSFIAMRIIKKLLHDCEIEGCLFDIKKLEADLMDYSPKSPDNQKMFEIMYNYSASKLIKYIRFINEFRRYTSSTELYIDLVSISFSHCSSNDPDYYFSFSQAAVHSFLIVIDSEWNNITRNGVLDADLMEEAFFGRFDKMVGEFGLKETIRLAYGDVGCHPEIQGPNMSKDEVVWGPFYKIDGNRIEKGCSDFRRYPWGNSSFELKFAYRLLENDRKYRSGEDEFDYIVFYPISDYSLPVYNMHKGKMHFETFDEKKEYIMTIEARRENAD